VRVRGIGLDWLGALEGRAVTEEKDVSKETISTKAVVIAIFIDSVGVGGRVGPGFHGVGADARGVGIR
jgi:hypothetical protein